MQNLSEQDIEKRFQELPDDVKRAIQSNDVAGSIQDIGKKHALHVDQMGTLEDTTFLLMLGFIVPTAFADELSKALSIPKEAATTIAGELSETVFVPIRETMQSFAEKQPTTNDLQPTTPAPITPTSTTSPITTPVAAVAQAAVVETPTTQSTAPIAAPKPILPAMTTPADHMLSTPTVSIPKKVEVLPPTAPQAAAVPSTEKKYNVDPYREAVE